MIIVKNKRVRRSLIATAIACSLFPAMAQAAPQQGQLGATSTGSITITATIPALVEISKLSDLTFTTLNGTDATLKEDVCVFSNTLTRGYTIKGSGSGASGAYTLVNSSNATIPYSVAWASSASASTGTALLNGTPSGTLTSTALTPTCGTGTLPTATLIVGIAGIDQGSMVANTSYTGTLTLLVTPV